MEDSDVSVSKTKSVAEEERVLVLNTSGCGYTSVLPSLPEPTREQREAERDIDGAIACCERLKKFARRI